MTRVIRKQKMEMKVVIVSKTDEKQRQMGDNIIFQGW